MGDLWSDGSGRLEGADRNIYIEKEVRQATPSMYRQRSSRHGQWTLNNLEYRQEPSSSQQMYSLAQTNREDNVVYQPLNAEFPMLIWRKIRMNLAAMLPIPLKGYE